MSDNNNENAGAASASEEQFALQRIYIKDLSFEVPGAPGCFNADWEPDISLNLNSVTRKLDDANYEVTLKVTVTVKNGDAVAYLIELQQAGLFLINGFPNEALEQLIGSYCPNILFPYAREAVSDLAAKGSFPQLLLTPVNFDALFAEAKRRQAEEAGQAGAPEAH